MAEGAGTELVVVGVAGLTVTGIFGVIVALINKLKPKAETEKTTVNTLKTAVDGLGEALDQMRQDHVQCREDLAEVKAELAEVKQSIPYLMSGPIPPYTSFKRPKTLIGGAADEE